MSIFLDIISMYNKKKKVPLFLVVKLKIWSNSDQLIRFGTLVGKKGHRLYNL